MNAIRSPCSKSHPHLDRSRGQLDVPGFCMSLVWANTFYRDYLCHTFIATQPHFSHHDASSFSLTAQHMTSAAMACTTFRILALTRMAALQGCLRPCMLQHAYCHDRMQYLFFCIRTPCLPVDCGRSESSRSQAGPSGLPCGWFTSLSSEFWMAGLLRGRPPPLTTPHGGSGASPVFSAGR